MTTKLQLPKGVLAIIVSAVFAVAAGAVGTWLYLKAPEIQTPESVALDGINVLLNADIDEFTARHAFMEADIGLIIRAGIETSKDGAVRRLVWKIFNELEDVLDVLEKGDIKISVADNEELSETDKDVALAGIYDSIVGDADDNQARAEIFGPIIDNVENVHRVDIEVSQVDAKASKNAIITVHVGMIDGKWSILSETLQ